MKNLTQIVQQLKQYVLSLFWNEDVFSILVDIYLQKQDQFRNLMAMLSSLHTAKCHQRSVVTKRAYLGLKLLVLFYIVCTIYVLTQGTSYLRKYSGKSETVCIRWNNSKRRHDRIGKQHDGPQSNLFKQRFTQMQRQLQNLPWRKCGSPSAL